MTIIVNKLFHAFLSLVVACALHAEDFPFCYEGALFETNEEDVLYLIAGLIKSDPVLLEAGAFAGRETLKFAMHWPDATIYSFEPNPRAYACLVDVVKDQSNVHPVNLALADKNGQAILHLCHGAQGNDVDYEGASSLLQSSEYMKINYQGPDVVVSCINLDDWCDLNAVDSIDFIWLDVEGMELPILKSSPRILKTVSVVFVETNFQEFRLGMTQYSELKKFLEDAGFIMLSHWYREGLQGNALFFRSPHAPVKKLQK